MTHQVQHLKNVPKIVLLDQGKIRIQGSYKELREQGMDFDSILKGYGHKEEVKDEIFVADEEEDLDNKQSFHHERHKLPPINPKFEDKIIDEESEGNNLYLT